MSIPDFAVHYFRAIRPPFLNLSDLPSSAVDGVLETLAKETAAGQHHRVFGRQYLTMRRETEAVLRSGFIGLGGQPQRSAPHYFCLGGSAWFAGLARDMRQIEVCLADLPAHLVSFTYGDSMSAMGVSARFGLPHEAHPCDDRVFRLTDLEGVVHDFGTPAPDKARYDGYAQRPFRHYIELQIWGDEPVREAARQAGYETLL